MVLTRPMGMMSHAVREAIDAMASPEVRDHVLTTALSAAGEVEVPEAGDRLRRFVTNYLGPSLRDRLGYDVAEAILDSLEPIVARASDEISAVRAAAAPSQRPSGTKPQFPIPPHAPADAGDRATPVVPSKSEDMLTLDPDDDWPELTIESPRSRSEPRVPAPRTHSSGKVRKPEPFEANDVEPVAARVTMPAPDAPRELPVVLIASANRTRIGELEGLLAARAGVTGVHDPIGLLDALQASAERHPVLIVDCRNPCVRATTIAAMAPDLPSGTTVVLWGADETIDAELDDVEPASRDWIRCTAEATASDVVSLCAMLLR